MINSSVSRFLFRFSLLWYILVSNEVFQISNLGRSSIKQILDSTTTSMVKHYVSDESIMMFYLFLGLHDDVIKWKKNPRYWPFVRGIHRSPVNSPLKGQWRSFSVFFDLCLYWTSGWVNVSYSRRHHAQYDATVMDQTVDSIAWIADLCSRSRYQEQGQVITCHRSDTVGCKCLSLPLIPDSGTHVLSWLHGLHFIKYVVYYSSRMLDAFVVFTTTSKNTCFSVGRLIWRHQRLERACIYIFWLWYLLGHGGATIHTWTFASDIWILFIFKVLHIISIKHCDPMTLVSHLYEMYHI